MSSAGGWDSVHDSPLRRFLAPPFPAHACLHTKKHGMHLPSASSKASPHPLHYATAWQ